MVLAQAVTLPPVAPQLKQPIKAPLCDLSEKPDYAPEEIEASRLCWRAAFGSAVKRYDLLRRAVSVRERAAAALTRANP